MKAYELYLIVKGLNLQDTSIDLYQRQLKLIDEAIELDPAFALGWALKGIIHYLVAAASVFGRISFDLDAGLNAALKAIKHEPNLGQAYLTLGSAYSVRGEFIEAELAYRKGMELTTESIDYFEHGLLFHYYGLCYLKKSHELVRKIREIDPLQKHIRALYMVDQGSLGNMKRVEEEYKHYKTLFWDHWNAGDLFIIPLRLGSKDNVSATDIPDLKGKGFGQIYTVLRENIDSPNEGLAKLHRLYSDAENLLAMDFFDMSVCAAYFGDLEFSLKALEKGAKVYTPGLFFTWLPVMKKVRQLPRFKEFVREIGLVDYWKRFGWPDLCQPVGDDDFVCE